MELKYSHLSLFRLSIGLLCLACPFVSADAPTKEEFTSALGEALRWDKFRFQYEVNLFEEGKVKSIFVDEAYSRKLKHGRVMMNHGTLPDKYSYSMIFWSLDDRYHESHWLRPFVCSTSRNGLNSGPIQSGHFQPSAFRNMSVYFRLNETDLSLQGIGAFLLNILDDNNNNNDKMTVSDSGTHLSWTLAQSEHQIEISIVRPAASLIRARDLESMIVVITKKDEQAQKVQLVASITILTFSRNFDNSLVQLPAGYSCSQSTRLQTEISSNEKGTNSPRIKYTYEVSITKGTQIPLQASRILSNHYSEAAPEPADTLAKPETQSKTFELLHDQLDDIIAVVSSRSKSGSVFRSANIAPTLSVWDFHSRKRHLVNLDTGKCEPARTFVSSLFGGEKTNTKIPPGFKSGCSFEGIEVNLSDSLKLRLNQDGLRWLTFTFQDRTNHMQLIDMHESPSGETEFVYERSASERFCLIDTTSGFVSFPNIRLVTRYKREAKGDIMAPKSSSLLFFDQPQSQLMLQVDLNLLHFEPYEPWSSARHLLDLSSCKTGYKESARVRIEYPLNGVDSQHFRDVLEPNRAIRGALATNFRLAFGVSPLRLASIEVDIREDSVQVELQLLERASLLSESTLMEVTTVTRADSDQFLEQLNKATRSVLVESVDMCADYCQLYRCEIFAFCNFVKECYIYTDPAVLTGVRFGSYRSLSFNCDAYQVSADRVERANEWRKSSWALEEIVESLTDSINTPDASKSLDPIDRAPKSASLSGLEACISFVATRNSSKLSSSIRLTPSYAEYHYDNLHSSALPNDKLVDPFDLQATPKTSDANKPAPLEHQPAHETTMNYFKILKNGYRFIDSKPIQIHQDALWEGRQTIDLDTSDGGYLLLENQRLDDCLRLCLNDLSCTSLSYCTGPNPTCTLTSLDRDTISSLIDQGEPPTKLRIYQEPRCTLMQRTYSDQFYQMEMRMLLAHSDRSVSDTLEVIKSADVDDCASACALNKATSFSKGSSAESSCLSFDFCQPMKMERANSQSSVCILFADHLVDNAPSRIKGDHKATARDQTNFDSSAEGASSLAKLLQSPEFNVSINSYCRHHGRNYLADFHRISRRRLPDEMKTLTLRNFLPTGTGTVKDDETDLPPEVADGGETEDISLARCASLCEQDPACGAFEYCIAKYARAPHNLYLSCSLSNEASFDMVPIGDQVISGRSKVRQLVASQMCSVYTYKRLSLILGHKKNLAALNQKGELELATSYRSVAWNLFRLDAILMVAFLLFGFVVRDLSTNQFAFRRMRATSFHEGRVVDERSPQWSGGSLNEISLSSLTM